MGQVPRPSSGSSNERRRQRQSDLYRMLMVQLAAIMLAAALVAQLPWIRQGLVFHISSHLLMIQMAWLSAAFLAVLIGAILQNAVLIWLGNGAALAVMVFGAWSNPFLAIAILPVAIVAALWQQVQPRVRPMQWIPVES